MCEKNKEGYRGTITLEKNNLSRFFGFIGEKFPHTIDLARSRQIKETTLTSRNKNILFQLADIFSFAKVLDGEMMRLTRVVKKSVMKPKTDIFDQPFLFSTAEET